jgi:hypothetical protein
MRCNAPAGSVYGEHHAVVVLASTTSTAAGAGGEAGSDLHPAEHEEQAVDASAGGEAGSDLHPAEHEEQAVADSALPSGTPQVITRILLCYQLSFLQIDVS